MKIEKLPKKKVILDPLGTTVGFLEFRRYVIDTWTASNLQNYPLLSWLRNLHMSTVSPCFLCFIGDIE